MIPKAHKHFKLMKAMARAHWWLLRNPEIPADAVYIYASGTERCPGQFSIRYTEYGSNPNAKAEAGAIAKELRVVDKGVDDIMGTFDVTHKIDDKDTYKWSTRRNNVCEKVVTGTKTVTLPAQEAKPERTVEEDIVEFNCPPSLLAEI